ncbi:phospholipase [Vibrio sp. 10N.286.49.B3]|uniref:patatin-like phospholipase family protein n=1 Tax=Vibrio sp. 10N.286.49.B3 TaxID=1880855 RepID=UPI000C84AB73|nr:patatin-like phospholipase family protein [Vibrio sp. 10N.286.49.B3]PMH43752.1 phospholipase [Vibrio sp. 10N.286.49.B3]
MEINQNKFLPIWLALSLFLTACSSPHTLEKRVTEDNYKSVSISSEGKVANGEPVRFWFDEPVDFLLNKDEVTTPLKIKGDRLRILALSGGGANGAYGAGVIKGLRDSGQLANYSIVTGISAGSLIAPFVFAGDENIDYLKEVMLSLNDKLVLGKRNFLNTLLKDAFTDGESMLDFIEKVYTPALIDKIALEHKAGRRLFIGTTHFDSEELVVWNIGRIAESDMPNKAELIHQILAASSSIPGVFPPQFINVNYLDEQYEELHVDGGIVMQMFFNPGQINYHELNQALGLSVAPQVHVIRNGFLKVPYQSVPDKGIKLLSRSLSSLTVQQAKGDLYRMMYISELNNLDLSFTFIEDSFEAPKVTNDMFDLEYMKALYHYGYNKAVQGDLWQTEVP